MRPFPRVRDGASCVALIAANLVPLIGVLLAGWDIAQIVLLYWAENLIIGGYHVLRMALARAERPEFHVAKLFLIPFFCLHYGGFCGVHGVFLLLFFKLGDPNGFFPRGPWLGPLVFFQILANVIRQLWGHLPTGMLWPLAALVISHGVSFVQNYLLGGEYERVGVKELMNRPYTRIVIMHVAIIAGGFFIMAVGSPLPLLAAIIVLKTAMDMHFHLRSHRLPKGDGPATEGDAD